jgi:hypothetical protein
MRFSEITSTPLLTEADLRICNKFVINETLYVITEAEDAVRNRFLAAVNTKLKNVKDTAITTFTNAADAMKLFYKILKDPETQIKATQKLRNLLMLKIRSMFKMIQNIVNPLVPTTDTIIDFFKMLLIYAGLIGFTKVLPVAAGNEIVKWLASDAKNIDFVKNMLSKIASIDDAIVNTIIASGGANIMTVIQTLSIGNDVFFKLLSHIYNTLSTISLTKFVLETKNSSRLLKIVFV